MAVAIGDNKQQGVRLVYIGQLYARLGGIAYPSPTFPRGGLSATFGLEVFALLGSSPSVDVTVEHKNVGDTSFTTAGVFSSIMVPGVNTLDVSGLKEQVRLSVVIGGASSTNMAYLNILPPMWRPY